MGRILQLAPGILHRAQIVMSARVWFERQGIAITGFGFIQLALKLQQRPQINQHFQIIGLLRQSFAVLLRGDLKLPLRLQ